MLNFETLTTYCKALERLSRPAVYYNNSFNKDADKMLVFTMSTVVQDDSNNNFDKLHNLAKKTGAEYFVITKNRMQIVGNLYCDVDLVTNEFNTDDFIARQAKYFDQNHWSWNQIRFLEFHNRLGRAVTVSQYGIAYFLKSQYGVFSTSTGKKLTRQEAVDEFWRLGFLTQRGRPLSVARPLDAGSRTDIEELSRLYTLHKLNRNRSSISLNYCNLYNKLQRDFIWPGMI
jgi:hypothetical protein